MYRNLSWSDDDSWSSALERAGLTQGGSTRMRDAPPAASAAEPPRQAAPASFVDGAEATPTDLPSRLHSFVQTVLRGTGASGVFVSDESGLEVVSTGIEPLWIAIAGQALSHLAEMRLALRSRETPVATYSLDGGLRLHVLEVPTAHGRFALGVVTAGELAVGNLATYRDRLRELMC